MEVNEYLSQEEKEQLKSRINFSIENYNKERKRKWTIVYSAAAVFIAFIVAFASLYVRSNKSFLTNFESLASVQEDELKTGGVRLSAEGNQLLELSGEEPFIQYSKKEGELIIDEKDKVMLEDVGSDYHEIVVPYGKRAVVALPEGTQVKLNSGSKLIFPYSFKKDRREVFLVGEAIFNVEHDKERPFFVIGNEDYRVKVLGTTFNFSNYPEEKQISTALQSGIVEVQTHGFFQGTTKFKMVPGEVVVYNKDNRTVIQKKGDVAMFMDWQEGNFSFHNQNLSIVLKKISRYYNVDISLSDQEELGKLTFSGVLDLRNNNLEDVLGMIRKMVPIEYTQKKTKVLVSKR